MSLRKAQEGLIANAIRHGPTKGRDSCSRQQRVVSYGLQGGMGS
eukprot:CAMPEP_0118933012 /NCGR_PEP_ID=MMETSP1169-20130426/10945_1 /TAXON_ID=36882 /ORGANISM="Pyramimonas obovata, Strain CCMP722" /LENGTH=43 /DNA_ID= /DNA_START= /DNA_END= /DNA_ORIENTATION=